MNKEYYFLFILILISFLFSCSKTEIKEIKDIQLKKEFEISPENMDSLESIALYSCDNKGYIYIYDDINKKVVVFDSTGNYTNQFGREGSGPGEFKLLLSIVPTDKDIMIVDGGKAAVIRYDYNGQFVSEKKVKLGIGIGETVAQGSGDTLISIYDMYLPEKNKIFRQVGLGVFSDSLTLEKDIYSLKMEYNPYIIDPNIVSPVFAQSSTNRDIAVSKIGSLEFEVLIFNNKYELINELSLDLPPIKYTKKMYNEIQEYYNKQGKIMTEQYGKKFKVKKLDKYTRLIKGIAYDMDSNLWISTPVKDNPDMVNIIIYDNNYQLKGMLKTSLPLGKMKITGTNLIYFTGLEGEDRRLEIYKIIKI